MKKQLCFFVLVFMAPYIYSGGEGLNDTGSCEKEECVFNDVPDSVKLDNVMKLINSANPDSVENFAKIRAILCSMQPYVNGDHWSDKEWPGKKFLEAAIKNNAKSTVALLFGNKWQWRDRYSNYHYNESLNTFYLNILAACFNRHEDPVGVLELFMSYRDSSKEFPKKYIPQFCDKSLASQFKRIRNRNYGNFCQALEEKVEQHNNRILERLSAQLNNVKDVVKEQDECSADFEKESEIK